MKSTQKLENKNMDLIIRPISLNSREYVFSKSSFKTFSQSNKHQTDQTTSIMSRPETQMIERKMDKQTHKMDKQHELDNSLSVFFHFELCQDIEQNVEGYEDDSLLDLKNIHKQFHTEADEQPFLIKQNRYLNFKERYSPFLFQIKPQTSTGFRNSSRTIDYDKINFQKPIERIDLRQSETQLQILRRQKDIQFRVRTNKVHAGAQSQVISRNFFQINGKSIENQRNGLDDQKYSASQPFTNLYRKDTIPQLQFILANQKQKKQSNFLQIRNSPN